MPIYSLVIRKRIPKPPQCYSIIGFEVVTVD
jgi:hypothetical protein